MSAIHTPDTALSKAKEELNSGKFKQAFEMAWLAADIALKAAVKEHNFSLKDHPAKIRLVDFISTSRLNEDYADNFALAEQMNYNYYGNSFDSLQIQLRIEHVTEFVNLMKTFQMSQKEAEDYRNYCLA